MHFQDGLLKVGYFMCALFLGNEARAYADPRVLEIVIILRTKDTLNGVEQAQSQRILKTLLVLFIQLEMFIRKPKKVSFVAAPSTTTRGTRSLRTPTAGMLRDAPAILAFAWPRIYNPCPLIP
jgi:hypothetical protein